MIIKQIKNASHKTAITCNVKSNKKFSINAEYLIFLHRLHFNEKSKNITENTTHDKNLITIEGTIATKKIITPVKEKMSKKHGKILPIINP